MTSAFRLSQRSLAKLEGVNLSMVAVVKRAIEITPVDFGVLCGMRTIEQQKALYAQGRTAPGKIVTWTMNSRHLSGEAVDLAAYVDGAIQWRPTSLYEDIADAMQQAADELGVLIRWGGTFPEPDWGHFELTRTTTKETTT